MLSGISKLYNKKFTTEISFYLITNFVQKISPFVILNLAALKLSSEDIGEYSYVILIVSLVQPLLTLELNRNVEYFFFKKGVVKDQMFSSILTLLLLIFIFTSLFSYFFNIHYKFIGNSLFNSLPLYIIAIVIYEITLTVFRNIDDKVRFFIFNIGHSIVYLLGFLFLLNTNYIEKSWKIIFIPLYLSTVFFGVLSLFYLFKNYNLKLELKNVRTYLLFSSPFILFVFSSFIANNIDKYFTEKYIGMDSLGVLAITLSYCAFVKFFSDAFMKAYTPMYFQSIDKSKVKLKQFVNLFYLAVIFLTIISIVILIILFTIFLPETYKPGVVLIPIISIAYMIRAFRQMFLPFIMKSEKTIYIALEVFVTILVGSLSTMFLVKNYGLIGAALALVVIQSTSLLYYYLIKKFILTKKIQ
jgi:O-antigen/teichoic acid export membrane protein